jgi:O-acetylhomoserine/O-acetylserine sulfhydrylase-like pyridoxal-dependent enzyme
MRNETIAIHAGYEPDPTTKAVAVPIYQTAAYAFDSADHGAALFNLEAEGYRYSRIANPTTAVLEKRIAELEGGVFLRNDPRVDWVNYAGFPDSPYCALVQKYLDGNASSLFTFGIKGGLEAGNSFYDALKLVTRLVNIGDAKSLACHPASTTHRQMSPDEQRAAGVQPETIRLSIGIEHIADIIEDLDQALAQACAQRRRLEAAE